MRKASFVLFVLFFLISTYNSYTIEKVEFNKINFVKDSLPNGLRIIYSVDKSAPVVAVVVNYKVGSKDENPERTGFAHFFEHLMFEASKNYERASIDKFVDEAGGVLNASTGFDQTSYFIKVPSNQIRLPLWIESSRLRGLKVDTIGVETQRGVVKEERKMRNDNTPYGTMLEKTVEYLFKGTSYAWAPIGSEQHIDKATIDEFRKFYDNFYQPNNAVIAIVGDINIEETKKMVRDYFGNISPSPNPVREPFKISELQSGYRETIEDIKAQLPAVFISYRAPSMIDKDSYPFELLNRILTRGQSSRLYQRLVDKEQVAAQAGSNFLSFYKAGGILFYGVAAPGKKIEDVEKIIYQEIDNIIKNGITDEELTKAKNILEAEFIRDKKTVLKKAQDLSMTWQFFGNPDFVNTELDKYLNVTKEDISRVAKKYLDTDKKVVLVYLPKN